MKLKLTESEVSQTIDLKEVLGSISAIDTVSEAFSRAIIDHIVERTQSGRDVNGKLFAPYSKSYKESLAFNVLGKSSHVDMTLTGDMLSTIQSERTGNKIKIFFDGPQNNVKAFAHMTGFKWHPHLEGKAKREFFGIKDEELRKIAKAFKPEIDNGKQASEKTLIEKIAKVIGFMSGE